MFCIILNLFFNLFFNGQENFFRMTDNYSIADKFSILSKLMDIHGENSFRAKSYSIAAYSIEQLPVQLAEIPKEKIAGLKGIGDSTAKKIIEILETGKMSALEEIIFKTPPGVLEMLQIKGLGPKKIITIWKEMEIESIGELLYACQENRLLLFKGFGAKTQQSVMDSIEFYLRHQGHFLYAEICAYAETMDGLLKKSWPDEKISLTGAFRRQSLVLEKIEWVTSVSSEKLKTFFIKNSYTILNDEKNSFLCKGPENIRLEFYITDDNQFYNLLFESTGSAEFMEKWTSENKGKPLNNGTEEEKFKSAGIHFIPASRREKGSIIELARKAPLPGLIADADIKGIIHSHSNWSDGSHTLAEMAKVCIEKGLEYLVISDHSKSAFYASGLSEERIKEQHKLIDELNDQIRPFRIFKSIECDILNDGSLDYTDEILSTFDLVITSIHSNLKMPMEKAMARLLKAIQNPYTTILGHLTGRLLLSRPGYPVDHIAIIEACKENEVVIEINAHPRRLDIDWQWIPEAIERGIMLSINPDAHSTEGYHDIHYGILAAQKGGLTKEKNLSSFSRDELEKYLEQRKHLKKI
jgi:DNA polymerase (family X)